MGRKKYRRIEGVVSVEKLEKLIKFVHRNSIKERSEVFGRDYHVLLVNVCWAWETKDFGYKVELLVYNEALIQIDKIRKFFLPTQS